MIDPPSIAAIRDCLAIIRDGDPPDAAGLVRALDRLVVAVHDTPEGDPADEETSPPKHDYFGEVVRLQERFPELGSFSVVWPLDPDHAVLTVTAEDALADIVGDLSDVLWRYENVSAGDAYWHLHLLFLEHWGVHLRELTFYLHFLLRERDMDEVDRTGIS